MTLPVVRPFGPISYHRGGPSAPPPARPIIPPAHEPLIPSSPHPIIRGDDGMRGEVLPSAESAVDALLALIADIDRSSYDLAVALAAAAASKLHVTLGFSDSGDGFAAFLSARLSLSYRKARYLIGIANTFSGTPHEQRVRQIGWSKARELTGLQGDDLALAVAYAERHTVEETAARVRQMRGGTGKPKHRRTFSLHDDQNELLETALALCEARSGKQDASKNLDLIVAEWLAGQGEKVALAHAIRSLEVSYGVRLALEDNGDAPTPPR